MSDPWNTRHFFNFANPNPKTRNMSTKPTAVAVIKEHLADGAIVAEFTGTLTSLFKEYKGKNERGDWQKRAGKMRDAAGEEIEVIFWNREVLDSWKGRVLSLKSVKGEKGTHGVTVIDDVYDGKTTRKLKVTATADVAFVEGGSRPASSESAPRQSSQSSHSAPPQGTSLKMAIMKRATVWNMCFDAAVATAHTIQDRHGFAMVPAGIAGLATTLYIETMRGLCGNLDAVDTAAVNWSAAKGKNLRDHLSVLDRQVYETRQNQAATPAVPHTELPPLDDGTDHDEIPF